MSKTAKNAITGKAVSAKQVYRYCKKWTSHLLNLIDNHETRITILEAQMEEVNKFIMKHHSEEEWEKFIKFRSSLNKKLLKKMVEAKRKNAKLPNL